MDTKKKVAPYKLEIEMLKKGVFNPNLKEELQRQLIDGLCREFNMDIYGNNQCIH